MSNRLERANSELRRCLTEIIQHKMNDPRLDKVISLTEVSVSKDFRYCKIKVSVLNIDDIKEVTEVLQKSEGYIKHELAEMVEMPFMPKLTFEVDKGTASELRVEEILRTLNIPAESGEDDK